MRLMTREAIDACRKIGRRERGITVIAPADLDALCDTAERALDDREAALDALKLVRDTTDLRCSCDSKSTGPCVRCTVEEALGGQPLGGNLAAVRIAERTVLLVERMIFGGIVSGGDMPASSDNPAWAPAHELALRVKREVDSLRGKVLTEAFAAVEVTKPLGCDDALKVIRSLMDRP